MPIPRPRTLFRRRPTLETTLVGALARTLLVSAASSCQRATRTEAPAPTPAPKANPQEARFSSVYPAEPDIRVRLDRFHAPIQLGEGERLVLARLDHQGKPTAVGLDLDGPVTLTSDGGSLVVRRGTAPDAPVVRTLAQGAALRLAAVGGGIRVGNVRYPGAVIALPATDAGPDRFDLIVEMPIESYLPGVLAAELYRDWPIAAFEAQAVAARSYALHERARSRERGRLWDVESTTADQAFSAQRAHERARAAALSTRGMVLRAPEGGVLRAYYSSTCGGRDASARDAFPTTFGYEYNASVALDAHEREHLCQTAPRYRWSTTRSTDELSRRIAAWGLSTSHPVRGVTILASITTEQRNALGRPVIYRVRDTSGRTYSIGAENLRVAAGFAAPGLPELPADQRPRSSDAEYTVRGPRVEVTGQGFGHGVGLCQYDARAFAQRGDTWQQMLVVFYPTAEIVRAF